MPDHAPGSRRETGRRILRLSVLAIGLLMLSAAAYHAAAVAAFDASTGPGPTPERLESARLAATLEPWEARFAWRATAIEGLALLDRGRVDEAYFLLEPYARVVRGDEVYRAAYQRAVTEKWPLDARKAHQQHAREQRDGSLREQDVFK